MPPIRVILVDDYPIIRKGIKDILASAGDIQIIAEAENGMEAISAADEYQPDVLILDMELPDMNGVEVTRRLKAAGSRVRILAFSGHEDLEFIRGTLEEGASGYLTKDESLENIVEAVRGIANGQEGWLSRRVRAKMMSIFKGEDSGSIRMTPRETQVSAQVVEGKTNQQIANALGISEKTVEKIMDSLFHKFNVPSRVALAVLLTRQKRR